VSRPLALRLSALVLSAALPCVSACAPPVRTLALPAPIELSTLGPGVLFELRVMREDGFSIEFGYVVAPDGTVDLPYVGRTHVAGLEPQDVAEAVRSELIKLGILSEPIVSVSVKEYTSKRIEVLGEVMRPGSLSMQPGLTLVRAISLVGGFSAMAAKTRIVIRRKVKGGTRAATISIEDVLDSRIPDPLLQAGDSIQVDQR
jgi:polysaccharide biosynthesis/export protein VpsN